jgi:hypothetical protein
MPSTDRKLELKAKTSVAQTDSQPYVYAKGLSDADHLLHFMEQDSPSISNVFYTSKKYWYLTLCRSNLNPYCLGTKAAFFSVGI